MDNLTQRSRCSRNVGNGSFVIYVFVKSSESLSDRFCCLLIGVAFLTAIWWVVKGAGWWVIGVGWWVIGVGC